MEKDMIEIVKECGDGYAGTWSIPSEGRSGVACWVTHYGHEKALVPWPDTLLCRYCKKTFRREDIRKKWIQPVFYSNADHTFNCGCHYIDSD